MPPARAAGATALIAKSAVWPLVIAVMLAHAAEVDASDTTGTSHVQPAGAVICASGAAKSSAKPTPGKRAGSPPWPAVAPSWVTRTSKRAVWPKATVGVAAVASTERSASSGAAVKYAIAGSWSDRRAGPSVLRDTSGKSALMRAWSSDVPLEADSSAMFAITWSSDCALPPKVKE